MRAYLVAILGATFVASSAVRAQEGEGDNGAPHQFNETTVAQLQAMMSSGELTSEELTQFYLERIERLDRDGPTVNSIIEVNPDALDIARQADRDRRQGRSGPLLGIPVLLKDNIDTGDRMQTGAGSFALVGRPALRDSTVAAKLRAGGAVILGKTNLSEWANFRSFNSTSGWSGRGRLARNPYSLDRNECGSSSGSAASVAANFTAVSLGTETDGSIVCPGNVNSVVGIKPTVGLTSRAGVVPISHIQDTVGPHGRTVADAAAVLGVIQSTSPDPRDPATGDVPLGWRGTGQTRPNNIPTDYTQFVRADGLRGAHIGVVRPVSFINNATPQMLAAFDAAVAAIRAAGAMTVDIPASAFPRALGETEVLLFDFKLDVQTYFDSREGVPMAHKTLADAIAFNTANAAVEMPFFFQEIFDFSNRMDTSGPTPGSNPQPIFNGRTYNQALEIDRQAGIGFDAVLRARGVQAIVAPTDGPAWTSDLINADHFLFASSGMAGGPGFPIVQVPSGTVLGMPVGISFIGTAFSEPNLIKFAAGFEAQTHARVLPTFAPSLPVDTFEHNKGDEGAKQPAPERNLMERDEGPQLHHL